MKKTILEMIKKIEEELAREEGLELKIMGEVGDLCRIVLKVKEEHEQLKKRLDKMEGK